MKVKKKDKFLSNILGYPSYNINSKNEINHFNKINNNFLLVLKITNHLSAKDCKNFDIKMRSKLITFKKEILTIENWISSAGLLKERYKQHNQNL